MNTQQANDLRKKAIGAMNAAVAKVIQEHLRTGRPLAVWRDGKVVMIPPEEAAGEAREEYGDYGN